MWKTTHVRGGLFHTEGPTIETALFCLVAVLLVLLVLVLSVLALLVLELSVLALVFINSLIADIYIAPLQVGLLRSAPDPSAAEQCCFELLKEFLGEYSWKRPESQRETILDQKANHEESPALGGGGASKWDLKETLLS